LSDYHDQSILNRLGNSSDQAAGETIRKSGAVRAKVSLGLTLAVAAVLLLATAGRWKTDTRFACITFSLTALGFIIADVWAVRHVRTVNGASDPRAKEAVSMIARTVKAVSTATMGRRFCKWAILTVSVTAAAARYLPSLGLPPLVPYLIGAVVALIAAVEGICFARIKGASLAAPGAERSFPEAEGETAVDHVSGLFRVISGHGVVEYFGRGRYNYPENALILTDKSAWVVTVPIEGAGLVLLWKKIPAYQWMFSRDVIEKKLADMLTYMSVPELVSATAMYRMPLEDLVSVRADDTFHTLQFIAKEWKVKYSFRQQPDYQKAKSLFAVGLGLSS
jgi:hypothetical protein